MIDAYLRSQTELDDRAVHLLFSANRWEALPALSAHLLADSGSSAGSSRDIICDRYAFSGVAYTLAKTQASPSPSSSTSTSASTSTSSPSAAGITYEWCKSPDTGLLLPDLVLFLDLPPEVARQRGGYGEERYEKEELQRRVREAFRRIERDVDVDTDETESKANEQVREEREQEQGRIRRRRRRWVTIDASGSVDEVEAAIHRAIEQNLPPAQELDRELDMSLFTRSSTA